MSAATVTAIPSQQAPPRARLLSFEGVLVAALATVVLLFLPRSIDDPDIWWHLRNAEVQLQTHTFLHADSYSFTTAGASWINYEWLAELPFYFGYRLMGVHGLYLVTAAVLESIFLGLFVLARRSSGDSKAALLATVASAFLSTVSFGPRTLLFGWLALVVELLLLQGFELDRPGARRRITWALPLLFLLWVNTHGSWIIGTVVLVLFVASGWRTVRAGLLECRGWSQSQKRSLGLACALVAPALFANPYGWRMVAYPFDLAFRQKLNTSHVAEWASLDFHAPRGHALLLMLVALFVAQVCRGRRWTPFELALLALAVYSAFTYSRFLFLAAILIAPLLARELPSFAPARRGHERPLLNALCLLLLATLAAFHAWPRAGDRASEARQYPLQAASYLQQFRPQGNVLNDCLWGGFLEWHARQIPVLIDSRMDIFERKGVLADYLDLIELKNSLALLDRYRIRYVLFRQDAPLVYLLLHTPGWKTDYRDGTGILLERTGVPAR